MGKILFFDLDNTLWDGREHIPSGTVDALRRAKLRGHRLFANTGRTRSFLRQEQLFSLGLDGIVAGCGTRVELPAAGKTDLDIDPDRNRIAYEEFVSPDTLEELILLVRRHRFRVLLEGPDYMYAEADEFLGDPFYAWLTSLAGNRIRGINAHWGHWQAHKLTCDMGCGEDAEGFMRSLSPRFALYRHEDIVEICPAGCSKGAGLLRVCGYLDADPADSVAFGDGVNDLSMFRSAGISVAMGRAAEAVRASASMSCPPVEQDGIARALSALGLI